MEINDELKSKRLFEMTAGEFAELLQEAAAKPESDKNMKKEIIKGRTQLAKRLGISLSTLNAWEKKGVVKAFSQHEATILYDLDEVLLSLKKNGKG